MSRYLVSALRLALATLLITGIVYPLVVLGFGLLLFPVQARGSLVRADGMVRGSYLIGQAFVSPGYFHPRPSAAGAGYDALASGGSNLGPTNRRLIQRVAVDVAQVRQETPGLHRVPVDMVTASGSGLDPDITLANAYAQASRVAAARGWSEARIRAYIDRQVTPRQWGIFGEARVNVLALNRALDEAR